ncbi:MAG: hypothetical protein WAX02_08025 [Methanothrix sp.]|uniref:hypothetical protein n=2 Tax=cellular organisms TaxID=131567 RepID=UPI0026F321C8|nr:hypothetical protein [Aminicella lysinilytica]
MNHTLIIIIGVLLFAIATATLYVIGTQKKIHEDERLMDMLLNNGAMRVRKYLKENDTITADGVGYVIKNIKAKEFYSKKTAIIANGAGFQEKLIDYMLRNNYLTEDTNDKGETVYRLPPKEGKENE